MDSFSFQPILITLGGIIIISVVGGVGYFCFTKFSSKKILKKLEDISGNLIVADDEPDDDINDLELVSSNNMEIQNKEVVSIKVDEEVQSGMITVNGNSCCKYCGTIIDDESKICKKCGKEQ